MDVEKEAGGWVASAVGAEGELPGDSVEGEGAEDVGDEADTTTDHRMKSSVRS